MNRPENGRKATGYTNLYIVVGEERKKLGSIWHFSSAMDQTLRDKVMGKAEVRDASGVVVEPAVAADPEYTTRLLASGMVEAEYNPAGTEASAIASDVKNALDSI